jgi:hypothetical protein
MTINHNSPKLRYWPEALTSALSILLVLCEGASDMTHHGIPFWFKAIESALKVLVVLLELYALLRVRR